VLYTITLESESRLDPAVAAELVNRWPEGDARKVRFVSLDARHPYCERKLYPEAQMKPRGLMFCPACGETQEPMLIQEPTGDDHYVRKVSYRGKTIYATSSVHSIAESGSEVDVLQCGAANSCYAMYEVPDGWTVEWE
jgi:hypothetical protein